ncbi:hypothetical protein Poly51_60680 [Rubripirellula tenax]|uniref:Uncharacterized protein n=1 Tax=Rubripirellula tenax TaxID=2528015 RepID=A0A5C6E6D2_9BACT|nr:hypothetical protein Poly51_60680 [Rubripirellula tenax]
MDRIKCLRRAPHCDGSLHATERPDRQPLRDRQRRPIFGPTDIAGSAANRDGSGDIEMAYGVSVEEAFDYALLQR